MEKLKPAKPAYQTIRLILGDQLNEQHSWFSASDPDVLYVVAEMQQETGYVRHHVQKVCAFFAAMSRFSARLSDLGHKVQYLTLDDTAHYQDLPALLSHLTTQHAVRYFEYQQPDEYRLQEQLGKLDLGEVKIAMFDTEHFFLAHADLPKYFKKNTSHKMEMFYRKMRKERDILMQDGAPLHGQWNFDQQNRNKLKAADIDEIPKPLLFSHDVQDILDRLDRHDIDTIGVSKTALIWPITRRESLELLDFFCRNMLPAFGTFQDSMTDQTEHSWTLYHSRLSFSLNAKLISPKEVVDAAITAFQQSSEIEIAQIEGFVRQILGWREFVRGIYWLNMPEYAEMNSLQAERPLPAFYWTGKTKMNCLSKTIEQSLDHAYAHHIQRLMVTGTFSLLVGVNPDEVDTWYLGIYIDAIEWVELPNTRGMSQAADNGIVATKPYAASGNYINKMSDYCRSCHYKVKEKTGSTACPYNSLYWHFMNRHRAQLKKNPRIGMVYKNWDKMGEEAQSLVLDRAEWCLEHLEEL